MHWVLILFAIFIITLVLLFDLFSTFLLERRIKKIENKLKEEPKQGKHMKLFEGDR